VHIAGIAHDVYGNWIERVARGREQAVVVDLHETRGQDVLHEVSEKRTAIRSLRVNRGDVYTSPWFRR